jgi:sulfate adenylyltransferase subunit 1
MDATISIAAKALEKGAAAGFDSNAPDDRAALTFITCGSVDDGKSTLIGRLLLDSASVLQDQLSSVQRGGRTDLALLTDGLSAEREQGITIDVAWRYFATGQRKFIIGDTPGHEQYTRNMVTAASRADAALVLIDATKLPWASDAAQPIGPLLAQTRRHALLAQLLRVPSIVCVVNKLDAVAQPALAFDRIRQALAEFAAQAGLALRAVVPVSALLGHNVVRAEPGFADYQGPSLLALLQDLPTTEQADAAHADAHTGQLALPVQWVEKQHDQATTAHGRRIFWGRVAQGVAQVGAAVTVWPSRQHAVVAQVLNATRQAGEVAMGRSAGVVLDREVDLSRGDWLLAAAEPAATTTPAPDSFDDTAAPQAAEPSRQLSATLAWLDDEPLVPGRVYWALHGHRWVKAKVSRIVHQLDIHTLAPQAATQLAANSIGMVDLTLQEAVPVQPFAQSRAMGSLVLVDTASHRTAGAMLIQRSHPA